ncbi:MAG: hypothetical protein ACE5NN_07265, partial [Candidatus Bathyarchaeia archaeon]
MKIREIRQFRLRRGPLVPKGFWEERLVRPVDIYESFRKEGPQRIGEEEVFEQVFLEITADGGEKGVFGPVSP